MVPPNATDPILLGTRASQLARTQSATVGEALATVAQRPWQEVIVRTTGDDTSKPLDQAGSPGLFVSALRKALLSGEADVIVHSYKDLPSAPEPGVYLAAVPPRVDSRDALVSQSGAHLIDLPEGARVGTSSPRRAAALTRLRPDLVLVPIRGNVDTRIRRVKEGEVEATILAVAGLYRIGRTADITQILEDFLPAPAQGALAIECRENDSELRSLLSQIDDPQTRLLTTAERQVLVGINAACTTAVAALATYESGHLHLRAELTLNGKHTTADITEVCELSDVAAARTLGLRAAALLSGSERPVLLVRSEGNESDAESLTEFGISSISDPYVRIAPMSKEDEAQSLVEQLRAIASDPQEAQRTWVVVTSPMTVPSWLSATEGSQLASAAAAAAKAGVRAAATGSRTAATLHDLGFPDVRVATTASAQGLVSELANVAPGRALFPRGNLALRTLPDGLRALGWQVDEGVVYRTETVAERPGSAIMVEKGQVSAVVLRSPSAVRALVAHVNLPQDVPLICAGRTTADAAIAAGLTVAAVSASPSSSSVARTISDFFQALSAAE